MHVSGFSLDLNWFIQFIITAFVIAFGLIHLLKNTASKYFMVDANFESSDSVSSNGNNQGDRKMPDLNGNGSCAVCGDLTKKQCSGCKVVRYCSANCQRSHWQSGHKSKCKDFQSFKMNSLQSTSLQRGRKGSSTVALVPVIGTSKSVKQLKKVLFPYEDFVELFNWNKLGSPPCGLLNCGNSCFANVVLQCLATTRPLVAYLMERGHRKECRRNDWCFLCEFQALVERARESHRPFSPVNILSRLPNIGGNLGYGKQEDAHEFMRFAIDAMQSVCLDEFGGEQALHPSSQETTLIQHIFGGHLRSQVVCTKCDNISNQYENMMDLTVEIQGDASSLEECLHQFTVSERLHGDNMYKCDGCNDYVMAWKRLTVQQAPNILTIALKRFQGGRFGKLNKRVTFPETLDLRPYMSELGDGTDIYKLFAVVVHVDMLNASFFGHYICYTKDFSGNWYRIDDCKVINVELEEVVSQRAYMLLYSRVSARSSCLKPIEPCEEQPVEVTMPADRSQQEEVTSCENDSSSLAPEELQMVDSGSCSSVVEDVEIQPSGLSNSAEETACPVEYPDEVTQSAPVCDVDITEAHSLNCELPSLDSGIIKVGNTFGNVDATDCNLVDSLTQSCLSTQNGVSEKAEVSHETLVAACSCSDEVNQMDSLDFRSEPGKVESQNSIPSSSNPDSTTRKSAGTSSSGAKLTPLFPSGFLDKRPGRKVAKKDEKASPENGKSSSTCNLVGGSNGFSEPCFPRQNGEMKEVGNSVSDLEIPSAAISFEKQVGKCSKEDEIVLNESLKLCNGYASASKYSDESICGISKSDGPLASS